VIFNLWISKVGVETTCVFIIHFMNHDRQHGHVTINSFETIDIYGTTMALQALVTTSIMFEIFLYVKDEGIDLLTIIIVLILCCFM
jgi:hypothetical protein